MKFSEKDLYNALQQISKQTEYLELLYRGWTSFQNNLISNIEKTKNKQRCQNVSNLLQESKGETIMKNIFKRTDKRYMIRKVVNGVRITKYADTLAEAKNILKSLKNNQAQIPQKEKVKSYNLEEYSQIWLETYKKPFVGAKSYSAIKSFILRINKSLGNIKLKELTANQIQEYFNQIPRGRSKEKMFSYFNSMLQKATDTELMLKNPCKAVVKDKKVKSKNYAYTYAEQEQILNALKNTDIENEIMIYLMCGCRPAELPQKANFDFENNIIHIYGTKNDNALHRQIEMSNEFNIYIQKYFKEHDVQAERYVSRKFISICNSIGISNPLLYRLRHTFATNHFTLGTQPKRVQQWLGHATISMTLDTYTDIDKTATKEKIQKLYNNFYYIHS
jgi:integrase